MFDQQENNYANIIIEFGIVGYSEQDIINRGTDSDKNLPLTLLYSYPHQESEDVEIIFQMMFPDDDHKIVSPKFFSLTLTNEKGTRSFLYCLKFPEKYVFSKKEKENFIHSHSDKKNNEEILNKKKNVQYIEVPLVIYIKSHKEDLESFKQLLFSINQIIVNDNLDKIIPDPIMINNYKKIQLINLLYFLFCLPHASPHTLVKLQLNKELDNILNLNNDDKNNETIDFYFSSNCEIPCNKNDTDINILFLILDQSIIIKVLFSILTEKQIIFTASQAYLLHLIISTFLKLIFPFKWHHSCITVLPKENLELLEIPGPHIFGVLSSHLSTKDLTDEFSGKIIVDCDTNEIFGYSNLEPFEPPEIQVKKDDKKKKDKKKNKEKEIEINNLESDNFTQGQNLIIINKNVIMKYENELNGKKKKLIFNNDNNIIIDTQKSQLFLDKNDIFIDSNDWKWLRKNIQLVRNPELFNLDNLDFQNKKKNNRISYDEDNPILPNRPFSYNIQNIILTFILKKLSFQESDFMTVFKKTNLYLEYEDKGKEYENIKGRTIVQNIEETKHHPRSIDNSFNIEFILNQFNVDAIIDKLKLKINNILNKEDKSIYQTLKKILSDYFQIKEEISKENNENNNTNFSWKIIERNKTLLEKKKLNLNINKSNKSLFRHVKNNTSLLQETSGQNKYILLGFDKDLEDSFQFYSQNGFVYFANKLDEFLKEENLDIKKIIYENLLNNQILNLLNKCLKEEEEKKEIVKEKSSQDNLNERKDSSKDNLKNIKLRQIIGVSIVPEKKEEDNAENDVDRTSNGSVEIKKEEDYDFAENLFNMDSEKNQIFNWNDNNDFIVQTNKIVNFSNFDLEEELNQEEGEKNEIKKETDENKINHLMQFYLFLAFYLEKAKNDKISLNYFFNNISFNNYITKSKQNEINIDNDNNELYEVIEKDENEEKEQKRKINEIIIRLYILAFNNSDKKQRDFPFFSFYNSLKQISSEDLKAYNYLFDSYDGDYKLGFIYRTIIIEKQQIEMKKMQKKLSLIMKEKNNKNKKEELDIHETYKRNSDVNFSQKKFNSFEKIYNRQTIQSTKINISLNKISHKNKTPNVNEITQKKEVSILIINDIGEIINEELSSFANFVGKNINEILEEMHSRFKSNSNLKDLIDNLKYINLDDINTKKKCFSFWLNCFNYLIIYTIFIQKLNLNNEKNWKTFFNTLYLNIGEKMFSFNDIQFILFKKPHFFSSAYKPKDYIKKINMEKIVGEFKVEGKEKLIPFILFLPINDFLKPSLFKEENIENDINIRIKEYLNKYIIIDKNNYLCCNDLFFKFYSNIFGKEIKKYENFFEPELLNIIKNKKYKKLIQKKITWQLNFDNLI